MPDCFICLETIDDENQVQSYNPLIDVIDCSCYTKQSVHKGVLMKLS